MTNERTDMVKLLRDLNTGPHGDRPLGAGGREVRPAATRERASGGILATRPGAVLIALAALGSFLLSVGLWFTDSREEALFVGLWVPSILSLGAFYAALGGRGT
jgi:hypothetical protein